MERVMCTSIHACVSGCSAAYISRSCVTYGVLVRCPWAALVHAHASVETPGESGRVKIPVITCKVPHGGSHPLTLQPGGGRVGRARRGLRGRREVNCGSSGMVREENGRGSCWCNPYVGVAPACERLPGTGVSQSELGLEVFSWDITEVYG